MHKHLVVLLLIAIWPFTIHAQTLKIPVSQQGQHSQDMNLPRKGMSTSQVVSLFGEPEHRAAPVGTPPISKWTYTAFSVYFENQTVIHTVLHPTQNVSPKTSESDADN